MNNNTQCNHILWQFEIVDIKILIMHHIMNIMNVILINCERKM
jgi:hypothetical protein